MRYLILFIILPVFPNAIPNVPVNSIIVELNTYYFSLLLRLWVLSYRLESHVALNPSIRFGIYFTKWYYLINVDYIFSLIREENEYIRISKNYKNTHGDQVDKIFQLPQLVSRRQKREDVQVIHARLCCACSCDLGQN